MLTDNTTGGNAALSFPILKSDIVTLSVVTLITGSALTLAARIRLKDGTIVPYAEEIPAQAANTTLTLNLNLPDGDLIGISLRARSYTIAVGGIWASVDIYHNANISTSPVLNLIQGYIGGNQALTWPYTAPHTIPYDAPPVLFFTATPAAGANIVVTGGAKTRGRILAIFVTFTTDANVANRNINIKFDTEYTGYTTFYTPLTITASLVKTIAFFPTAPIYATGGAWTCPIPENMILPYNASLEINAANIQAGDQWSAIQVLTEIMTS